MTNDEARMALAKLMLDPMWRPKDWPDLYGEIDDLISRGFAKWYLDSSKLWQVRILPAGEEFLKGG